MLAIAREPESTMRDLAAKVGITERATQQIVADLVDAGYLLRRRAGRRNTYQVKAGRSFRHPLEQGHDVDELLMVLVPEGRYGPPH